MKRILSLFRKRKFESIALVSYNADLQLVSLVNNEGDIDYTNQMFTYGEDFNIRSNTPFLSLLTYCKKVGFDSWQYIDMFGRPLGPVNKFITSR